MSRLPRIQSNTHVCEDPHVVILGAGASRAACPNGDARGRRVPLMNDIVETLGLKELLPPGLIQASSDFEALYDRLVEGGGAAVLAQSVEARVRDYFSELQLPESVTIYDQLLLSLRGKDLIATFNWDPFLEQAWVRNRLAAELPRIVFLHGSVGIAICRDHRNVGRPGDDCIDCKRPLEPVSLLYPVRDKDYRADLFIRDQWDQLERALCQAYQITFFGYSAPTTDKAAIDLLERTWNANEIRGFAQVSIIDIARETALRERWNRFFISHHFDISNDLERSWFSNYPRRTCEALAHFTMLNLPFAGFPFPTTANLGEFQRALRPLIDEEINFPHHKVPIRTDWTNA